MHIIWGKFNSLLDLAQCLVQLSFLHEHFSEVDMAPVPMVAGRTRPLAKNAERLIEPTGALKRQAQVVEDARTVRAKGQRRLAKANGVVRPGSDRVEEHQAQQVIDAKVVAMARVRPNQQVRCGVLLLE